MIATEDGQSTRRMALSRRRIYGAALAALVVVSASLVVGVDYVFMLSRAKRATALAAETQALEGELKTRLSEVEALEGKLSEVRRLDSKLRTMTDLSDEGRRIDLGVQGAGGGDGPRDVVSAVIAQARTADPERLAAEQASLLSGLYGQLATARSLKALLPSGWPTRGWLTSTFGLREDPFSRSDEKVMHSGLDIVAPVGTEVRATGPGQCVFAGERGAYGLSVVIEHGRGYATHYAHLDTIAVKTGDVVKRGQPVGTLGNTGKSTGAHLHYEVRLDGVPTDPARFLAP